MSGRFFLSGTIPLFEGNPQPLSTLTFSLTGTSTAQDTYADAGLTSANTNPVVSDANGYFGEIFIKRERYKVIWKNAAGTTLKTWDPVDKDQVYTRGAGLPSDPHPGQKHANTSDGKTYEYKLDTAAWLDLGDTDAISNTASVTQQLTGTSTSVYATPDSVAALWQRGTDIASASTLSLPSTGGHHFNVTGTTGVTSISSAQGGRTVRFKFASSLTITHDGTSLILPGGVSITTRAGDIAEFTNEAAADASGSNWRLTDYFRNLTPIETPSSAKTGNYTVAATDRGGFIRFSGLSADATLTLPAVSGLAGFKVTFANTDGTYAVTVDGNSSETIDGFTTRKHSGPGPITLFCDGSAWYTMAGRWRSVSAAYTLTASTTETYAHGLGVTPASITFICTCINASAGYATGDKLILGYNLQSLGSGSAMYGWTTQADATNVYLRSSPTNFGTVVNQDTFLQSNMGYGDWSVRIVAEA